MPMLASMVDTDAALKPRASHASDHVRGVKKTGSLVKDSPFCFPARKDEQASALTA
jgi:hypothetical protein